MHDHFAIARFKFVWNDLLNSEKDNETQLISTGTSVLKQIFDKLREEGFKVTTQTNLTFGYQTNADINVSVSGDVGIAFELSNNCTYF